MSIPMPTKTTGKIILVANIVAKPGTGDQMQVALAAIRTLAESTAEVNTHTYRTSRGEGPGNEDNFVVFEEYVLPNGINEHIAAAPFQALGSAGIVASLDIKYYEEFSS